jgi:hypothetical protein
MVLHFGTGIWPHAVELVRRVRESNPLGELKELWRTRSVDEYQQQFLALLCHCDGLSAAHAMNLFTTGLGEPMTSDVEMQYPDDLQSAMSMARAFECRASVATKDFKSSD